MAYFSRFVSVNRNESAFIKEHHCDCPIFSFISYALLIVIIESTDTETKNEQAISVRVNIV